MGGHYNLSTNEKNLTILMSQKNLNFKNKKKQKQDYATEDLIVLQGENR
jgi:hypothetical protein